MLLLTLLLSIALCASGQKKKGLDRKLEIYWKSKHFHAMALAGECNFHPGDTVADIGTADGWFAAALSAYTDSVVFYLEDVDAAIWNAVTFDSAARHFSRQQNKSLTNQFFYAQGTERSSGLTPNAFHKVLIIDTYHHLEYRYAMLQNAVSLLKPGGKLIILETLARKPGDVHQGCRTPIYSEKEIVSEMATFNMHAEKIKLMHKVAGRKNKLFVFVMGDPQVGP
jgi:predicted methyltransferase